MIGQRRALSLRTTLLLSYLLVVAVGVTTLLVAARLAAPEFFSRHHAVRGSFGPQSGPMPMGGMQTVMTAALQDAFNDAVIEGLTVAGAAATVAAVALGVLMSRYVARPVQRLATASSYIAAGDYAQRVPEGGPREVAQLATSFNEMASALEDVERRRLALIGDVAHELRTPIATLQGYLEGLSDGVVQPSAETLELLQGETARLARLVEDLQNLSRAESHQLSLSPRAVEPVALARAAINRFAQDLEASGLTLKLEAPNALPFVWADPDRVTQVLTNLVTNAIRYTPAPGCITVRAVQAGEFVWFSVEDTGIGIAAEDLPHLFERFYRVDRSRARASGGSGIGLTIAKALVEAMGGSISATSPRLGRGATFTFTLPIARGATRPS